MWQSAGDARRAISYGISLDLDHLFVIGYRTGDFYAEVRCSSYWQGVEGERRARAVRGTVHPPPPRGAVPPPFSSLYFFFLLSSLELSDTKVYEP